MGHPLDKTNVCEADTRSTKRRILFITIFSTFLLGCVNGLVAEEEFPDTRLVSVTTSDDVTASDMAVRMIEEQILRSIISEFSSDKYEGRAPGSRGDRKARLFLVEEMRKLGLQPGTADGGWQQNFDLVSVNTKQPERWAFDHDGSVLTLDQWDEFMVASGVHEPRVTIEDAELVFVGYGIEAPEYGWDDFKDVDVRGKVLVIMNNDPDWAPNLFEGNTRLWYGRWDYKYKMAAELGAAGAIIIHTTASAGYPFQVLQTSGTGAQFELPKYNESQIKLTAWITEDAAHELLSLAGFDFDNLIASARTREFEPVPLGITTSISMDVDIKTIETANVLGLIAGSDPELKNEVVIYTAHHDHLGVGAPNDSGDAIYNGAMDNATGVAMLMSIARATQSLPEPPRRSILFAFVGAEEQGLLGSQWYVNNPTFPPGKIAANINFDGGNIFGRTHDVTYVGMGKTSLDNIVMRIAHEQGRVVRPDQFPDRGYFYRSDQFSFAKIGVPALYLEPGLDFVDRPKGWGEEQANRFNDVDYHQPSDEYDEGWVFDGMIDDARIGFLTGLEIANADKMPAWKSGDEFEAARIKALASE